MDAVSLLQVASALLLNIGFAWLVGTWFARRWMDLAGMDSDRVAPSLRKLDLFAAGLGTASGALVLLAATAVMGGVGLREACPMFWMMVTSTDFGHAGIVTVLAMTALFFIRLLGGARLVADIAVLLALIVFAVTRASMGHAGEDGWWTLALVAEAVHLAAIGLWTGAVLVSAWFVLKKSHVDALGMQSTNRYLESMSKAALIAVVCIGVTGVYSGWHRIGTAEHLAHTSYGMTLLVKLALVLVAIALGGYNKYVGLPAARRSRAGIGLTRAVLRIESVVLAGVLLMAAILTTQQPPATM
jgi:putative copper resistance protein D